MDRKEKYNIQLILIKDIYTIHIYIIIKKTNIKDFEKSV